MNFQSIFSQLFHYVTYKCSKRIKQIDKGRLIISIDIDVGSEKLGEKNEGRNDLNVHNYLPESVVGKIEEQAMPLIVQFFNDLEVPVTFALRGELTEIDNSIINIILQSPINHDIGAHGYSHKAFITLSRNEAERELKMISMGMKKFGIKPKSFVFPKNMVAHLPLLEKWGYLCFRGYGDFLNDGMYLKKYGNLYDIHPGLFLGNFCNTIILKKIIDLSVKYKAPFHVWFHIWDLGHSLSSINKRIIFLLPLLKYAKEKQKQGILQFETMHSLAEKKPLLY